MGWGGREGGREGGGVGLRGAGLMTELLPRLSAGRRKMAGERGCHVGRRRGVGGADPFDGVQ